MVGYKPPHVDASVICLTTGAILAFGGLIFLSGGIGRYSQLQDVKITPLSKARSAAVGIIELIGKARPIKESIGPFSKEKCAYWHLYAKTKSEYVDMGRSSQEGFYLEDESGRILIPLYNKMRHGREKRLRLPNFHCAHTKEYTTNILTGYASPVKEYVAKQPEEVQERFGRNAYKAWRFIEEYIKDEEDVYILGRAIPREEKGSDPGQQNLEIEIDTMRFSGEKDVVTDLRKRAIKQILLGVALIVLGALAAII